MSYAHFLGVRCNLCDSYLKIFEVADGWDKGKILPGLTKTAPAVIVGSMIDVWEIALGAGWEPDPADEAAQKIDPRWTCRMCAGRIRCMHSWIKANRITDEDEQEQ